MNTIKTSTTGCILAIDLGKYKSVACLYPYSAEQAEIFYTMMRYGVTYQKQSEAEFVEQNRQRLEKSLRRRAKELGFELKKIEAPPPDPAAAATPSD